MRRSFVWVVLPTAFFCLFLIPDAVRAQVIPGPVSSQVTGTAGINTGLVKLGHTDKIVHPTNLHVDWGDGTTTESVKLDCVRDSLKASCDYWGKHTYANPDTYNVTVHYGYGRTFTATAVIAPVGNFVIVSIGDSVASGEGNPVVPMRIGTGIYGHGPYWDTNKKISGCSDRSSLAAPVLAAQQLQANNPGTRITILHMGCSGATITGDRNSAEGQLQTAINELGKTKIDALLMTVGADNVDGGFSNVVMACVGPYPTLSDPFVKTDPSLDCSTGDDPDSVKMREDLEDINGVQDSDDATADDGLLAVNAYQNLDCEIQNPNYAQCPVMTVNSDVVDTYITQYFDPTHDYAGNTPTYLETQLCSGDPFANLEPLLKPDEWSYLYGNMVIPLNQRISNVARQYGWHYVKGIQQDFLKHGYCTAHNGLPPGLGGTSWVVSLAQSLALQKGPGGTSHPNSLGQADYARRIYQAINIFTPTTTVATATSNGKPYTFGTWTTHDVEVSLKATNKLATAGVGQTYFSEDDSTCTNTPSQYQNCIKYQGPFTMNVSGKHTLNFFSSNKSGTFEKVETEQVWIDNAPPVMNCYATPSVLWAPNHKLVPVNLNVTAVSAAFGPTPITLTSVTTSEGNPATDIQGFTLGKPSTQGWLRASRTGTQRAGRVYTFAYKSIDPLGLTGSCTTTVTVPHDQGRR